jgi:hypothetical protein
MADDARRHTRLTPLVATALQLSTPPSPASTTQSASMSSNRPAKRGLSRPQRLSRKKTPRAIFNTDEFVAAAQHVAPSDLNMADSNMAQVDQNMAQDAQSSSTQDRKRAAPAAAELSSRSTVSQHRTSKKRSKRGLVMLQSSQVEVGQVEVACHKSQTARLKRAQSSQTVTVSTSLSPAPVLPPRLLRCHNSEQSISAMSASAPPPTPLLPTMHSSRHPDLNVVTPETVAELLRGGFQAQLRGFLLLDCRFPFEFEGGSLQGASLLCDPERMEQWLFSAAALESCTQTALIFFCEFSANRAPKMLRHVRNVDRRLHADCYPELYYPELYLVDGGYNKCFETLQHELCTPSALYVRMEDERFVEACRQEFANWRRRWKPHKAVANCAAKLETSPRHDRQRHQDGRREAAAGVRSLFDEL